MWSHEAVGDAPGPEQAIEGGRPSRQEKPHPSALHPPSSSRNPGSVAQVDAYDGRSIGSVRDRSAPMGVRMILFICIIGDVRDQSAPTDDLIHWLRSAMG